VDVNFSARRVSGIVVAVVGTAVAALLRVVLDPMLGDTSQYAPFYISVLAAAALGGWSSGLLAMALGVVIGSVFFIHGALFDAPNASRLGLFLFFSLTTIILLQRLGQAQRRLQKSGESLAASQAAARKQIEEELQNVLRHAHTFVTHAIVTAPPGWDAPETTWGAEEYRWESEVPTPPTALEVFPLELQLGQDFHAAFITARHPDDAGEATALVTRAMRTGERSVRREFRAIDRFGKVHWFNQVSVIEPLPGARGRWRVISINTDISEARLAEQVLRDVMRQARCVIWQASLTGMPGWDTPRSQDHKLGLFHWNQLPVDPDAAAAVLEVELEPGETWAHAVFRGRDPEDNERMYHTMVGALQRGDQTYEQEYRCRDRHGEVQWLFERVILLPLGPGRWRTSGITINVTQRKRAEQAMQEVSRHARCILNVAKVTAKPGWRERWMDVDDPPFLWEPQVVNADSAQEIVPLELKPGETYHDAWWRSRNPKDCRQTNLNTAKAFVEQNRNVENYFRCTDRYGREHWMRQLVRVDAVGEGQWRTFGIAIDITDERRAAEALHASERHLKAALELAEQASRAKDHFLAVLSHELRTPLTPVAAGLDILEGQGGLSAAVLETLAMIRRNVTLEARLIDDLLDVTRIARGKIDLELRPVLLSQVIAQALEVVAGDIEARELHLHAAYHDCACMVGGDATRLQQVFWNLLRNAIKFTPHGGNVWVNCRSDEGAAVVEVRDDGEGIAAEDLARIFNAFEQAKESWSRQFGGLGLGLTISRMLVELHGGTIEAHSEGKGKGATFRVRLPLIAQPAPGHAGAGAADQPVGAAAGAAVSPRHILLVEDHGDTAKVMRQLLRRQGHTVEWAGDMASALDIAGKASFDLLISDIGLPDGSGLELLQSLRQRGWKQPAIALSGYGLEQDMQRSFEAGFVAHLTKPTSVERLVEAIAAAMPPNGAGTQTQKPA
jgi:signal transduction histidine kinase/CheY-like chemotaxis protein